MFPKMNPKQMAQMMRQFGISTREIDADKVTISKKDGSSIEIRNPSVVAMEMQGTTNFQITGEVSESSAAEKPPEPQKSREDSFGEDVKLVMEQAKVSREAAIAALNKANGNIAEAIVTARGE